MCPSLIRLVKGKSQVIVGVSTGKLREDILRQLASLPAELRAPASEALQLNAPGGHVAG